MGAIKNSTKIDCKYMFSEVIKTKHIVNVFYL